ncbi:protein phosphatase Slingshot homolog 2 isoform X2 [Myripristis murdjan]|uniref:protein-serine/threonine phosphatase n=1 Tax=Myripristis murdjan TaxID=586833 RepID=A0A667YMN1_9TELE|nr:protein phosphatase Slingshot homolog 2-like isoform X2 [Myripristis murdjan]
MALVTVQRSPTPSTTSSPCVSESGSGDDDRRSQPRSISESFLTVKGAALFLPRGNSPTPNSAPRISQRRNKHTGDLQQHLQTMFTVLRPEDTIRLAVRLESAYAQCTRYMVVVSTNGRQDTEESIVLGIDFSSSDSSCTVGLVLPLWSDTLIHLDGDGGFSVSTVNRVHVFKPVSVQAMWSALQSLHKACEVARCHNYYPGSLFLTWVSYYQSRVSSDQFYINEWNAMQDVESHRADSPVLFTDVPTERERTERLIKMRLREIMMQKDLENVTSKEIRTELEMQMACNLREFKEFIDNEMIVILGQMDSPTEIFEHVYLGSEWNASNLEELQNSGVRYILNVTREIDNFFPGMFEYHNIRVYDEEATNLLEYWNETYKFITKAKKAGAKCLVHCKMGVSRSASTVIAYAMKEYGWDLDTAFDYVKERRAVTKPNPSFMKQLEEYQGILLASKQRHNKLWRSHSDSDLSDRPEPVCKPASHTLGRSDPHNNNNTSSSLHHFLGVAVLQALGAEPQESTLDSDAKSTSAHNSHPQTQSNGVFDSLEEDEVKSDCVQHEDPLLPPLPRPRAATVVPENRMDNSEKVAVTLPVGVPHPPPSFHILPPSPEPPRTSLGPPTQLLSSVHECKPVELSLNLVERSSSEDISPLTVGSSDSDSLEHSLSESVSNKVSPLSPLTTNPLPLVLSTGPSDDNNNPSELQTGSAFDSRGEADGSSNHSTDSIDFFSAREKFLGLAQDTRTRTLSEQTQQRAPLSLSLEDPGETVTKEEEEQGKRMSQAVNQVSPYSEDIADKASPDRSHQSPHHDNGISVRHIVTEIESISHPTSSLPTSSTSSSSSPPPSSHSPQPTRLEQQEDGETVEVTHGSLTPPSHPQSPSTPPCDWPSGSVRRATKQLEQKLRQEMEMSMPQRSPLHSPSTEHPPIRTSLSSPSTENPPVRSPHHSAEQTLLSGNRLDRLSQGVSAAASANAKPKDREKQTWSHRELQRLNSSGMDTITDPSLSANSNTSQVSGATPIIVHTSEDSHTLTQTQTSSGPLAISSLLVDSFLDTLPLAQRESQLHSPNKFPAQPYSQPMSQNQQFKVQPQASSNQMTLDGVTVQESDTDERLGSSSQGRQVDYVPCCDAQSRLSRGSQELERIQQTLRELQAFLHEAGGLETRETLEQSEKGHLRQAQGPGQPQRLREVMDTEPEPRKGESSEQAAPGLEQGQGPAERQGKSFPQPAGWQRAMELEARIRQAGLTPPSLMKRSASLAKLDCLELSANDLNDWDLRPHNRTPLSQPQDPSSILPSHPDDTLKKQRVLVQIPHAERTGLSHHGRAPDNPSSPPSLPFSSSPHHCWGEDSGKREEPVGSGNGVVTMTTLHQQGRGHSLRRSRKASAEKKQRTVTVLYNTM